MESLVSIIIPVFNMERYLSECLESVTGQTYNNIEILVSDDGSTDSSFEICKEWANVDSRVIVIKNTHEGVSHARNVGIERATGKWVLFVDSDDYLEKNAVEYMVNTSEKYGADLGIFDFSLDYSNRILENGFYRFEDVHIFDEHEKKELLADCMNESPLSRSGRAANTGVPWGKLYLRERLIANSIAFPYGVKRMQDMIFNLTAIDSMEKIIYVPKCVYHYRFVENSACRRHTPDFAETAQMLKVLLRAFIDKTKYYELEPDYHIKLIKLFLEWIQLEIVPGEEPFIKKLNMIRRMAKDENVKNDCLYIDYSKLTTTQKVGAFMVCRRWWFLLCAYYYVRRNYR